MIPLKASQPAVLRLAYLLATGSASRTKAEEMANLAFSRYRADSPVLGHEMYGLGQFYENLGEYAKALTAYENSYSWFKQHNSTDTARPAVAIARVCFLEGDYDVAWTKAKTAEEFCLKAWGPNYFRVNAVGNTCLEILAAVARSRGDS